MVVSGIGMFSMRIGRPEHARGQSTNGVGRELFCSRESSRCPASLAAAGSGHWSAVRCPVFQRAGRDSDARIDVASVFFRSHADHMWAGQGAVDSDRRARDELHVAHGVRSRVWFGVAAQISASQASERAASRPRSIRRGGDHPSHRDRKRDRKRDRGAAQASPSILDFIPQNGGCSFCGNLTIDKNSGNLQQRDHQRGSDAPCHCPTTRCTT